MTGRSVKSRLVTMILLAFLVMLPASAAAQTAEEDVVYLKDGSVIRGTIVEQKPGERISIRTRDGSVFRYQMSQIDRLAREPVFGVKARGDDAPGLKDPGTATLLSVLVAGGGQLYSGETNRGLVILGVGLGSLVVGAGMSGCDFDTGDCTTAPLAVGSLVYLATWIYGIVDADESAHRMNEKRGLGFELPSGLQPVVNTLASGRAGVGIRVVAP